MAIRKIYKDIDMNFKAHPITGDVIRVFDEKAVEQSIKTLIRTKYFERRFQSRVAGNVESYLFEPFTGATKDAMARDIRDVIQSYEPRATISNISVSFDDATNGLFVSISFSVIALDNPVTIKFILQRAR